MELFLPECENLCENFCNYKYSNVYILATCPGVLYIFLKFLKTLRELQENILLVYDIPIFFQNNTKKKHFLIFQNFS